MTPQYRSRFAIQRDGDGWTIADYQRGGCVSFTTRAEARDALRFVKAYAAKWGDVDLESFPYSLDEPFNPLEPEILP